MQQVKDETIWKRLSELQGNRSNTRFAQDIGISRNTVNFWLTGQRIPDAGSLKTIAQKCAVSVDWILGLTDVHSPDNDLASAVKYTGLSEVAVQKLAMLSTVPPIPWPTPTGTVEIDQSSTVSAIIADDGFFELVKAVALWINAFTSAKRSPAGVGFDVALGKYQDVAKQLSERSGGALQIVPTAYLAAMYQANAEVAISAIAQSICETILASAQTKAEN